MTEPASHEQGPHPMTTAQVFFSPAEWTSLQADDRKAATQIVGLLLSIFTIGVLGYIAIAIWVS